MVLDGCFPEVGQLLGECDQVVSVDAGESVGVGRDRTIDLDRRDQGMSRPAVKPHPPSRTNSYIRLWTAGHFTPLLFAWGWESANAAPTVVLLGPLVGLPRPVEFTPALVFLLRTDPRIGFEGQSRRAHDV